MAYRSLFQVKSSRQKCRPARDGTAGATGSAFDLGEIGDCERRGANLVEQAQPVRADRLLGGVDRDLVEEGVDRGPQGGQSLHRAFEIFIRHMMGGLRDRTLDGVPEMDL